jgi:hypothetical protein
MYVVLAQSIIEERVRTIDDVLDGSSESEMDASVNSDSDDSNYCASASEYTGKHYLYHKPNFRCRCLL